MLVRYCENLLCLDLSMNQRFTDGGLGYFTASCVGARRLEHLNMSGCVQISLDGFSHLAACCSKLKSLTLDHNEALTDQVLEVVLWLSFS